MELDNIALRGARRCASGSVTVYSAVAALLLSVLYAGAATASPCVNLFEAADGSPTGFGAAYNPLSSAKELLLRGTECDGYSAKVAVGGGSPEQYVYKKGMYWDGAKWQGFDLS